MNLPRAQIRKARGKSRQRRGTEVVELAVILPVLMLILFSTLEICDRAFLLQKVKIAAHEGAIVAIVKTATLTDVEDAVKDYLDARNIDYGDNISTAVSVSPDLTTADTLTPVTVTVTVPTDKNSRVGGYLYQYVVGNKSAGEVTMLKEFKSN